ncbi:MAG: acetate/propionate family kinase [Planctomycetota bacterium]|nr:acetate/propionate family kinase [Planctomycetota bacterium]
MEMLDYLKRHPLFEEMSDENLKVIADGVEVRSYAPGELLIEAGRPGVAFGILIGGRAEAVIGFGTPARRRLGLIGEGECFGEISLMTGESTSADVVALTDARAMLIPESLFYRTIPANRKSVQYLSRLIARRLRARDEAEAGAEKERREAARPSYAFGASSPMRILVLNCGSSSVKYDFYDTSGEEPLAGGLIERIGTDQARHVYRTPKGKFEEPLPNADHAGAIKALASALTHPDRGVMKSLDELSVIGHRVVHGGSKLNAPTIIDEKVKATIREMCALAPLHNPVNMVGIEVCEKLMPGKPQVAVFDTAFHQRMPPYAYLYAVPKELAEKSGVRRYGFHGTSHEFVARAAAAHLGRRFSDLRLITCHLGNGVSMAAVQNGHSVDTTMGLTPLEGLVMGTRSGDIDPGILLHLMRTEGMSAEKLDELLNRKSGLKGLSGISHDMRELEAAAESGNRDARIAIQVFCYRIKKYIGAYMAAMNGADAIIFTAGIGEKSPVVRGMVCHGLSSLGVLIDDEKNSRTRASAGQVVDISDPESRVKVLVIGTDEQRMIARQSVQALGQYDLTQALRKHTDRPIPIGVSAHHVHLTKEHFEALFGAGRQLTPHAPLSQPGQFACKEQVTLVGPKSRIERVRILGPFRKESQVEISRTEEFKLGIDAPIRMSGDVKGSPAVTIEGPAGTVHLKEGVICAMRHIHMSPEDALEFALRDRDVVRVRVEGPRSLIFGDVMVRVHPDFRLELHLDTDEANAAEISQGAVCYLDSIQERRGQGL